MSTNDSDIRMAAEEYSDQEFSDHHLFTATDETIIRRLIAAGPVLLRGPRGSGKSAYMLAAHQRIRKSEPSVLSVYVSLRYFPLLYASAEQYLDILIPFIAEQIQKEFHEQLIQSASNFKAISTLSELRSNLDDVGVREKKRIVLLFDDVAHIGREISLSGFFGFFRTLSSSVISCKAAIYPGVTKFGTRFDFYNDATVVEAQRDERSSDFQEFFDALLKNHHPNVYARADSKLLPQLGMLLGRTVLGNVRAFNALCRHFATYQLISLQSFGDSLKWYSSSCLYPALDELETKLGSYVSLLNVARDLAEIISKDCGRRKVNSMIVHRDHVQRIGKVFEILEYTGFIAKREASRSLLKSGTGRGPRYVLSLGPLFENVPGSTMSYDLSHSMTRVNVEKDELVEYEPLSIIKNLIYPEPTSETLLDVLKLSIDKLKTSNVIPYGLTDLMVNALTQGGYETVEDVVKVSVEKLDELPQIGEKKARRIRNAVEQAIWM